MGRRTPEYASWALRRSSTPQNAPHSTTDCNTTALHQQQPEKTMTTQNTRATMAAIHLPAVAPEQFDALLAGLRLLAHELGAGRFNLHHEAHGCAYTNDGEHDGLSLDGMKALDKLLIAAARQSIGNAALGGYFTATDFASDPTTISCACESCDWRGVATVLHAIGDCSLTPGDASPAGRCPECDTLAYVVQPSAAELALALGNMTALAAEAIGARAGSDDSQDRELLPAYQLQLAGASALLAAMPPRAADDDGEEDDSARTVAVLREAGYAVLTFSPTELNDFDAAELESVGRAGVERFLVVRS